LDEERENKRRDDTIEHPRSEGGKGAKEFFEICETLNEQAATSGIKKEKERKGR
jgi:hypothetical protein